MTSETRINMILKKIQSCTEISEATVIYFEKCFDDIIKRTNETVEVDKMMRLGFTSYLSIPNVISKRIYEIFVCEGTSMSKNQFREVMFSLYFGNINKLEELIFKILDLAHVGRIFLEDVLLIFFFFKNSSDKNLVFSDSDIETCIVNLFGKDSFLVLEEYLHRVRHFQANILLIFYFFLCNSQPFTYEGINLLNECTESIYPDHPPHVASSLNNYSYPISEDLIFFFKSQSIKLRRKLATKNVLHFNTLTQINTSETNISPQIIPHSINKNNKNENKKINFLENIKSKVYLDKPMYMFDKSYELQSRRIILLAKELFIFKINYKTGVYSLEDMYPLSGYYVTECDDMRVGSKIYFPFALINRFGNSFTNIKNIFVCEDKKEMKKIVEKMKKVMKIRNFEDFYTIREKELGKGKFGTVKLGKEKKTNKEVAVKIINRTNLNLNANELIHNEIEVNSILKVFKHENVVDQIDLFEDRNNIYLVMEYINNGSLAEYLEKNTTRKREIYNLSLQIAEGVDFLHKIGIVHRDIKPENILIEINSDGEIKAKISDFGLSHVVGISQTLKEGVGTLLYSAPEILLQKSYDRKVDVWSFGIVLFYINFGYLPFDGDCSLQEISRKICFEKLETPIKISHRYNEYLMSLIKKCLAKNAAERYEMHQVLNSKWLQY